MCFYFVLQSDSNWNTHIHSVENEQALLLAQVLVLKTKYRPSISLQKAKVNTIVIIHGVPEAGDTNPFYIANLLKIDKKTSSINCHFLGQTSEQDGPFASTYKPLYLDSRQQFSTAPQPKSNWTKVASIIPWVPWYIN